MQFLKKLIPVPYKERIKARLGSPSLLWSLENLRRCGFNPYYAVDGGAYEGEWTREFLSVFPNSNVLMIEAQLKKEEALKKVVIANPNVDYSLTLLGSDDNHKVHFVENETISYASDKPSIGSRMTKVQTLDSLLIQSGKGWPDFLKLDVQGFELEVLSGASQCFEHVKVCLLEVSVFDWGDRKVPLIAEVLDYMYRRNFVMYDIVQITRRPFDKALNQIDCFFVPNDSILIKDKRWI